MIHIMGSAADYFLTAGLTWCDLLSHDCVKLSIDIKRGYAHDNGERMQIVSVGGHPVAGDLSIMYRPWGLFVLTQRSIYVCLRDLSIQDVLCEIVKWSATSAGVEKLLTQLGAALWSYELFTNAGVEMSMLLLRNSGWELLQLEENLFAYEQFAQLTGKDICNRDSLLEEEMSLGSIFTLPGDELFQTDRDVFWIREMELRKLLVSSLSAKTSEVRQVYFLDLNHDGFRINWPLYGGDQLSRLPWPGCFLNTSGELVLISPEIGEAVWLKGHLGQITAWGNGFVSRLSEWSYSVKSNQL